MSVFELDSLCGSSFYLDCRSAFSSGFHTCLDRGGCEEVKCHPR